MDIISLNINNLLWICYECYILHKLYVLLIKNNSLKSLYCFDNYEWFYNADFDNNKIIINIINSLYKLIGYNTTLKILYINNYIEDYYNYYKIDK